MAKGITLGAMFGFRYIHSGGGTDVWYVAFMEQWHTWDLELGCLWSNHASSVQGTGSPTALCLRYGQCGAAMELGTRTRAFAEESGSGVQVHLQWLQCLSYRYLQGSCRSGVWSSGKHSVVTKLGSETWAYMEHPWLWDQGHVWVWGWGTDSPDSRAVEQKLLMREVQHHVSLQWSMVIHHWLPQSYKLLVSLWSSLLGFALTNRVLFHESCRESVAEAVQVLSGKGFQGLPQSRGHYSKWWHLLCGWYWYLLPFFVPSHLEMSQISQPSQWPFSCGYSVLLHCVAVGF